MVKGFYVKTSFCCDNVFKFTTRLMGKRNRADVRDGAQNRFFVTMIIGVLLVCFWNDVLIASSKLLLRRAVVTRTIKTILPWMMILSCSYELCAKLKSLYDEHNGQTSWLNDYRKELSDQKKKFLEEMFAVDLRMSESKNRYLDAMQKLTAENCARLTDTLDRLSKEEQQIKEQRETLQKETVELDEKLRNTEKELRSLMAPKQDDA